MYLNDVNEAKVICECDTEVTFAIRNDVEAFLNEDKIICISCDGSLPKGMKNLYRYSKKLLLKKGVNVIKAENDLKYLPSVILLGDFTYEIESGDVCALHFNNRKKVIRCVDKITDFGVVTLECKLDIPTKATKIEVIGADLLTECYIENTSCGKKAFTPYIFEIDKEYDIANSSPNAKPLASPDLTSGLFFTKALFTYCTNAFNAEKTTINIAIISKKEIM